MRKQASLCYISVIAIIMAITSCQDKTIYIPIPEISCSDSTLLKVTDTLSLNIGNELNPIPYVSQLYISDSTEVYIAKDEQQLYFYDLFTDSLLRKVNLNKCPELKAFSGFKYWGDSVLIYCDLTQELLMLDEEFEVVWKTAINKGGNPLIHVEALSGSPLLFSQEHVILSGTPGANPYKYNGAYPVSVSYGLKDKAAITGGGRPEFYQEKSVGGNYMWRVFHTLNSEEDIVYSFPLYPYIAIYSNKLVKNKEFYMGSRYSNLPLGMSPIEKMTDSKEKSYYLNSDTYGPIIFDQFRNVYYRIATHPKVDYREGEMTLKPFSIIVMDCEGIILSETPVFFHNNTMFYDKIYISSRGLLMQVKSDNENEMKFLVFTLKDENTNN